MRPNATIDLAKHPPVRRPTVQTTFLFKLNPDSGRTNCESLSRNDDGTYTVVGRTLTGGALAAHAELVAREPHNSPIADYETAVVVPAALIDRLVDERLAELAKVS
jgi:hypothetical protein